MACSQARVKLWAFTRLSPPARRLTRDEVTRVVAVAARRIDRLLQRRGVAAAALLSPCSPPGRIGPQLRGLLRDQREPLRGRVALERHELRASSRRSPGDLDLTE